MFTLLHRDLKLTIWKSITRRIKHHFLVKDNPQNGNSVHSVMADTPSISICMGFWTFFTSTTLNTISWARTPQSQQRLVTDCEVVQSSNPENKDISRTCSDRHCPPPPLQSHLYNGHRGYFSGVKRSQRGVDHHPDLAPVAAGTPNRSLLQWTNQLPTHHNNRAYLRLYSAVCVPDDGCK
jgi:hypothetical protein